MESILMSGNSLNPCCLLCVFTKKSCLVETQLSCVYFFGRVSGHVAGAGCGDPERASCTLKNSKGSLQICVTPDVLLPACSCP